MSKSKLKIDKSALPETLVELMDEGAQSQEFIEGFNATQELIELGNRVKEQRQRIRLTQRKLAALAGMNQVDVSRIESGTGIQGPTYLTLLKLSRALEKDIFTSNSNTEETPRRRTLNVATKI